MARTHSQALGKTAEQIFVSRRAKGEFNASRKIPIRARGVGDPLGASESCEEAPSPAPKLGLRWGSAAANGSINGRSVQ